MSVNSLPLLSAMFLAKFDVHSGYKLEWFKSNNEQIYTSRNLEFKALPSGLHSVPSDTVCFVQPKGMSENLLLYGISVFRQNRLDIQRRDDGATTIDAAAEYTIDRSRVKMFSLGFLIDAEHINAGQSPSRELPWKPKIYSGCWQYRAEAISLLDRFMECESEADERAFFANFDRFFEQHRFKIPYEPELGIEIRGSTSAGQPASAASLEVESTGVSELASSLTEDHMVYGLHELFDTLGPLLYKAWKLCLLRKKIVLYVESHGSVVTATDEPGSSSFKIEDLCRFVYCLSLISSIPKEILSTLRKSGIKDIGALEFHAPIYNLCVDDIDFLKGLDFGFVACTTDQIILEKPQLYDYCVRLPASKNGSEAPEILAADQKSSQLASHRDHETFEVVKELLGKEEETESDTSEADHSEADPLIDASENIDSSSEVSYCPYSYYGSVSEGPSIREMIWKGLNWWATAGESSQELGEEFQLEASYFSGIAGEADADKVDVIIALVGYFQKLTTRLFNMLVEVVLNNESDVTSERVFEADSELSSDSNEPLLSSDASTVWIQPQDMYEMGLDPYSRGDCEFVRELVKFWWGKDAKIGGGCAKLCCLY
ncbi:DEKNAAC103448 [Brettanomyces naardenensis]|uniref:DEKNAAC103448 n=1 Tax=Brettanomyces naardenensis TaxID=13370 RepID=A0A448YP44_BRENA|nr:DEKNAAC103448 [Brettanomyces naardenensis]